MKSGVRIRENGSISSLSGTFTQTNKGVLISTSSYPSGRSGRTMWMRDFVTPDFQRRRAEGQLVNNGARKITTNRSDVGGGSTHSHKIDAGPGREVYTFSSLFCQRQSGRAVERYLFSEEEIESMRTEIGTQCAANVESSTADGLVTLAEMTKTLRTLKRPFENIERLVKDIGKSYTYRKYHKAHFTNSLLSFMEKEWLRLRYGFRPMMYDIQSTADAFWNLYTDPKVQTRVTARARRQWTRNSTDSSTHIDSTFTGPVSSLFTEDVVVRCGILYERGFENDRTMLNRELGLQLSDLPSLAWEITPWSFIGDWVVNMGDFISAWSPRYGIKKQTAWTTTIRCRKTTKNMGPFNLLPSVTAAGWTLDTAPATGTSIVEVTDYERSPFINTGLTYRVDSLPRVGNDVKKVLDLYSLFHQSLRK